jgi:membrane-associated phospholipid phosphatase
VFFFSSFKRPHGYKELIQDEKYQWLSNVEMPSYLSFPSGHTTVAFCIFFGLALIIPNKRIGSALVLLAILVGFSRTYLSYHFLMDLIAGSMLGVLSALIMYIALKEKLKL